MKDRLDADALAPLWSVVESDPEPAVRVAAIDAASRFALTEDAWRRCAALTREIVVDRPTGSPERRMALGLAVRIPLRSVRHPLRRMAEDPSDPDRDALAAALDAIGDPSRVRPLLQAAREDRGECFEKLAAMPVEAQGVSIEEIAPLPDGAVANAALWRALLLARLGDFATLDALLEDEGPEPELFWGDPWTAYNAIAAMRPVPQAMREHLLAALERFAGSSRERMVQLIAWAATGVADAEGTPVSPAARGASSEESEAPAVLPADELGKVLERAVVEANKRAQAEHPDAPVNILLGNEIVRLAARPAASIELPVAELARVHIRAKRPALDDGQMAWILARDRPEHLVRQMAAMLLPLRPAGERLRALRLLASAADHQAGRGGSPMRGAGPAGAPEPLGRGELIDDMPRAAMAAPPAAEEEERRVHAQIWQDGKSRRTFLAGGENVIRCWIGLPEPEKAAVAGEAIPVVHIPPGGLPLTAELCWGDQADRKPLLLPAERTARSGDCDLRIRVPEGERYVSAEIAFRYRGRAFELVQVEAFALAAGEAEQPQHSIHVRVQSRRREVIELPESAEFDATVVWGPDPARAPQAGGPAAPTLRVFGGQGGHSYSLKDSEAAIRWLNESLYITEKSLVRRRAAQAGAEELLDAGDAEVRTLLRDMARHGANLYNQLREQGFEDPGERIQLVNREPDTHVPLEFVYDRGYPADDAALCEGWLAALKDDARACPACAAPIREEERSWMPTICPLGFWSLQKIIERIDEERGQDAAGSASVPRSARRSLPVLDGTVFASSHRVPEAERQSTWRALQESFRDKAVLAENWELWKEAVKKHPPLLLVLPHHDVAAALDYLQIGEEGLAPRLGHLSRGQLTELYVNPQRQDPGPIVLLLGCRTAARIEGGYVQIARRFQKLHTSIVLGTLAEILGRHAAPLARELVGQLVGIDDPQADFGSVMRRVRRRMLARGYLMALCLIALGDAQWRLTPRGP